VGVSLTEKQQAVVDDRGGSLLVSAAAGSGKTRVLVERLFSRVLGPERANVDDFLIITYTRAAAAELRERIAQELTERLGLQPGDRHLQRQLLLVYQADIKTVDSFCTNLLRENVHLLDFGQEKGLTTDFRVLDESEGDLMRRRVLARVLEDFYANLSEGGKQLADAFGFGRDDRGLEELVLELYGKIQSHAYPLRWLREQKSAWADIPESITDTVYGQLLLSGLDQKAGHWITLLRSTVEEIRCDGGLTKSYGPAFESGIDILEKLRQRIQQGWDDVREYELAWPKLVAVRKCEAPELKNMAQSRWNRCKKEITGAWRALDASGRDAAADLRASAPAMEALLQLCEDFSEAYRREKLRRNVTDFSDQEHYTVQLLLDDEGDPTELADTVGARYQEVMVDEFQDTNQVQNCIFDAITRQKGDLFTVGDVKQSIYRFRLADPSIFLKKYIDYPEIRQVEKGPRKILLSQNFRSRQSVLDGANFIFRAIMSREMGELDYGEEEQLNFGASFLPQRTDCGTEFHLLGHPTRTAGAPAGRSMAEARFVAARIRRMLDEGFAVTDEETRQLRPCREEDFAILMRSPGPRIKHYAKALAEQGIACSTGEKEDFFSTMEVAVVYALLQVLDNPRQDVPLIAVLRSPIFGFTPDRLAMIRGTHRDGDFYAAMAASGDDDCVEFLEKLEQIRLRAKDMSVHRLIWHLYNELNILGIFGAMAGGERRRENLLALCDQARSFEGAGYKGLFSFVSHLRFLLENGEQPFAAGGGAAGGVHIMSVHKSKGLEFPVVFLADLNKPFNKMDLQTPVLVHPKLGLGPMFIDLERHIRYPTAARQAIAAALSREMRSEEMRVLYVAMTRAREKLIMVATMTGVQKTLADLTAASALPVPPETVDSARSMAEWILLPLLRRREGVVLRSIAEMEEGIYDLTEDSPWLVEFHDGEDYAMARFKDRQELREERGESLTFDPEALNYRYDYMAASVVPSKITATQIKGRSRDREIQENTRPPYAHRPFLRPAFLESRRAMTAGERGTATHLVMQYLSLEGDPKETVRSLVERRLLTEEQGSCVNIPALKAFLASPLAQTLRRANRIEREYRFSLLAEAGEYYIDMAEGEKVLLQGVVDLFAETEEGIIVVDFKTDRVDGGEVLERAEQYRPQITAYSTALERITGKKVFRRVLYFLTAGQEVDV